MDASFLLDHKPAILNGGFQPACGKRAAEHHLLCGLGNINESAAAGDRRPELAHIDIALCIRLCQTQKCGIQTMTGIKIELRAFVQKCIRIA